MTDGLALPLDGEVASPAPGSVAEHDARRCTACGARWPSFGFGPPLVRRAVWACGAHRAEVGRALAAGGNGSARALGSPKRGQMMGEGRDGA